MLRNLRSQGVAREILLTGFGTVRMSACRPSEGRVKCYNPRAMTNTQGALISIAAIAVIVSVILAVVGLVPWLLQRALMTIS
jgi:hypothetical protein